MGERINRGDDENLYQPKIHSKRIRSLYQISEDTNLPMTVLVDLAIKEFLERYEIEIEQNQDLNGLENFNVGDRGGMLERD
jgi:hypothetical protein